MQIHSKITGTKGFVSTYNEALRFRDMITLEAQRRARILTFWRTHGLAATKRRSMCQNPRSIAGKLFCTTRTGGFGSAFFPRVIGV